MKILVTGAFGNVGEKVLDKLIQNNYDIRIFELKSLKNWIKSFKYKPSCEIMWGNLLNKKSVRKAVEGVDVVIHLAAINPPLADEKPEMAYEVNVNGTKNIIAEIERIEKENRPKLIYTSSIAIYGDRRKNPHIHVEDELK